jgi:hypothetical protein
MSSVSRAVPKVLLAVIVASLLPLSLTGCTRYRVRREMHDGNAAYKAEQYEKAIRHYESVVKMAPSRDDAWLNMAYSYRAMYRPGSEHPKDVAYADKGIEAFRKYMQLRPDDDGARQYYLEFCQSALRYDNAIALFEEDLRKKPNDPQKIRALASLYLKKKDVEGAMKLWRRWTQVDPQNPESYYTIGVASFDRSYKSQFLSADERRAIIKEGMEALGKALEIRPDYFDALAYMNLLYRERAKLLASEGDLVAAQEDIATADRYQKKALDVRRAQIKAEKAG